MSRRTRILLGVSLGLIAWFAVTVVWASRPLSDSVPIGKGADTKVVVANVQCNTLFDGTAMEANELPVIVTAEDALTMEPIDAPVIVTPADAPAPWALPRMPCTQVHDEARLLFGINVAVFVLGLAATAFVATRTRRPPVPRMTAATA